MLGDVASALTFLAAQPGVDRNRIGVIGASYGSSLALIDAAGNKNIKALALLSPGLNYFMNLPTEPAIQEYGDRPILIVAAEDDAESANATRRLDSLVQGNRHQAKVFPGGAHGTGILESGVGLDQLLLEFFSKSL
jgi:dienelactone hydrolase